LVTVLWSRYFGQQQGLEKKEKKKALTKQPVKECNLELGEATLCVVDHAKMQNSADHVWRCLKEAFVCMTMMMAIPCTQPLTWPQAHSD